MKKCSHCTKQLEEYSALADICQTCWNYFSKGGKVYNLPLYGELKHDEKGYVICHICGRSYKKLGAHVYQTHQMTIAEYKATFGLNNSTQTTEENYHNKMHNYIVDNFDSVVKHNLIDNGKQTRFIIGSKGRTKDKIREETMKKLKRFNKGGELK